MDNSTCLLYFNNLTSSHLTILAGFWPTWVPGAKEDISVPSSTHGRPRLCWVRDLPSEHQPGSSPNCQWGPQTSVAVISLRTNLFMMGISISFFIYLLREILQPMCVLSFSCSICSEGQVLKFIGGKGCCPFQRQWNVDLSIAQHPADFAEFKVQACLRALGCLTEVQRISYLPSCLTGVVHPL